MPQTRRPNFAQVRSWLNEIHQEKTAASKSAKAYSEPDGRGETSHPVKDVEDGLTNATTGSRASENEKDVKEMNFAGQVDSASEGGSPSQEELNYNIGVEQSETGGQPSVEDDYKTRPSDPGTSHPANTEDEGKKYGHWLKKEAAALSVLANEILADIATGANLNKPTSAPQSQPTETKSAASVTPQTAVQAGYELAALMGMDKAAADATTEAVIAHTIKQAQLGADRVGAYIVSFMQQSEEIMKKRAAVDPAMAGAPPMDPAMAGGMPPEAGGGPPGEGGGGLEAALAAGGGEGGMPPEAGGAPPEGEGGGGGGDEAALQELAMALMELGISPEELQQMVASGGGGEGGMPPEAGGAPPAEGSPADMGAKIASAVKSYKRSGRFRFTEAKTATQKNQRNEMKNYIREIIGSSRS